MSAPFGETLPPYGIGHNRPPEARVELPEAISEVFANPDGSWRASRYKVLYGGRGSAKSWTVARILVTLAASRCIRVLCCREFQNSIADSVHRLLADQIDSLGLTHLYDITEKSIYCLATGSEFIFKGIKKNIREIKSLEGIDICWVEEAQSVSKESWQILRPTIRKTGSEIWATFNPDREEDATYQLFIKQTPPASIVKLINWRDNPWFAGTELEQERLAELANCTDDDRDAYEWIWEGAPRRITAALIFRRRVIIEPFEEPTDPPVRPYYGADYGFADDPAALVRFYITTEPHPERPGETCEHLWITHEAWGLHVEIDDLKDRLWSKVPGSDEWPIKADNARPEITSYMSRQGYNVASAEKWQGCVEDGVDHLKGYYRIHIHPRCEHTIREFKLYSYKVDPNNGDILPIIVDKHNHCIDALRYGHDGIIQKRGGMGVWSKLAG